MAAGQRQQDPCERRRVDGEHHPWSSRGHNQAAQAASLLPVMFISLPAGVLADVLDRRHILLAAQSGMVVIAVVLTLLTAAHLTTPALLITMTFRFSRGAV